jgi:phage baseplate assembly protein W
MSNPLQKDFLGVGWGYPVGLVTNSGSIALAAYEDDVKQALRILMATAPGERVMQPNFGCGIYDLAFEVIDQATITRVESVIRTAISSYEARIELMDVSVDASMASAGVLHISIDYRIRRTNQVGNMVYPFYFAEGALP